MIFNRSSGNQENLHDFITLLMNQRTEPGDRAKLWVTYSTDPSVRPKVVLETSPTNILLSKGGTKEDLSDFLPTQPYKEVRVLSGVDLGGREIYSTKREGFDSWHELITSDPNGFAIQVQRVFKLAGRRFVMEQNEEPLIQ